MSYHTMLYQGQPGQRLVRWGLILAMLLSVLLPAGNVLAQQTPTVASISPNTGVNTAQTNVTITGTGFFGQPTVRIGNTPIQDVSLIDSTRLLAVVQAGLVAGTYDVTVVNPDNQVGVLPNGFTVQSPPPDLRTMLPSRGRSDVPNDLYLYGFNFSPGVVVSLVDESGVATPLATTRTSSTRLKAIVEANMAVGIYDVRVTNPGNVSSTLDNVYTVYEVANDDLYANGYELWTEPVAMRANNTENGIGLVVYRQGGKQPVAVQVHFYVGDPSAGGTLIGTGTIAVLGPRQSESTSKVPWVATTPGTYEIFAVIDPNNNVTEALENNNKVSRTVTVLPQAADQTSPRVDSFTINNGNATTTTGLVPLDATASDPSTSTGPGSGVSKILYQEFEYSQGAGLWVPVQNTGWLTYTTSNNDYPLTLMPNAGVKYLQAWAQDAAGNISIGPFKGFISHVPPTDTVGRDQTRVYRYTLAAGQRLTARIEPVSGDPDLYIWVPDPNAPPYVSNLSGTAEEEVSFVASAAGVYQVEVYGYSATEYRLSVTIGTLQARQDAPTIVGGEDPSKPKPTAPAVPLDSLPLDRTAIAAPVVVDNPPPPATTINLYLPTVTR